jgi:hypothetical protein
MSFTAIQTTAVQSKIRDRILDAFPHEVIKVPLQGPDNQPSPHYGLCFDSLDAPQPHFMSATVKKHYIPHTREDVAVACETIAAGLELDADQLEVSAFFKKAKGHRVSVQPTAKYRRSVAGSDTVWPAFILNANYGGALQANVGMKRDVCSNLQMMRKVTGTTVNLRHQGNFRTNFDETMRQWQDLAAKFDNIVEAAKHLQETRFSASDFYSQLYPEPTPAEGKAKHTRYEKKIDAMLERLAQERLDLNTHRSRSTTQTNLWELVNSVTGFVQHEKRNKATGHRLSKSEQAWMGVEDKECDRAWSLALGSAS